MVKYKYYASLIFIAFIWGSTFPIIKETLLFVDPLSFLFLRFLIASIIILPLIIRRINRYLAIYGSIVGITLFFGYLTQTIGLEYTTPSMSGLITGLYVILTPILSIFFLKRKMVKTEIILATTAFFGVALMSLSSSSGELIGNILTLFCAISYALQIVLTEKYLKDGDALQFTFYQLLMVAILSLVFHPQVIFSFTKMEIPYVMFSVLFNAVLGSALAIFVMSVAIKNTNSYISALILISEPLFAVLISTLVFRYPINIETIVGGSLILVSMAMAIRIENKK
ncbi:MAG: DMT family transporter [Thermoplasmatales archaeon]